MYGLTHKVLRLDVSILILSGLFLYSFISEVNADVIYLKNGRSLEGIIKTEDENSVELEVGFGTVKFQKEQIERIYKSHPEELRQIERDWQRQRIEAEAARTKREQEEALKPRKVEFSDEHGGIFVNAVLNKKVEASLLLDTGASFVMLTKKLAQGLGIDLDSKKDLMQLQLADGRKVDTMRVILDNVKVEEVEAADIEAAILLEDVGDYGFKDGLLGMSFLNRFNFKIDYEKKELILEKFKR